jgi:hypothetical protein
VLEYTERTPGASEIRDHREHARGHERVLGFANDQIHTFVTEHPAKVRAARVRGRMGSCGLSSRYSASKPGRSSRSA